MSKIERWTPEKRSPSAFWPLAALAAPVLSTLFRFDIEGELPKEGPFIIAANHLSELDPVVLGYAVWRLGRLPRYMAKESLFRAPGLGPILRATDMVPVERRAGGRAAIDAAGRLLERGAGVVVYPEGTLTRDPALWPMKGKSGVVRMAAEHGIPLYPVAHWGTQAVFARYAKAPTLRFRAPVSVRVGAPFAVDDVVAAPSSRRAVEGATDRLMREIARLQGEIRGEEPPAELYDPARAAAS